MEIVQEVVYFSDEFLDEIGFEKDGLTWIIDGKRYRLKEATANGIYFYEVKRPS